MDFLCLFVIFDDKSSTTNGESGGDEVRKIPSVQNSRNCRVEGNTNCTRTDGFPEFAELESFLLFPIFLFSPSLSRFPSLFPLFLTFHIPPLSVSLLPFHFYFPLTLSVFHSTIYSYFLFLSLSLRYLVFNLVWYYFW
jgi:hypothetical protein